MRTMMRALLACAVAVAACGSDQTMEPPDSIIGPPGGGGSGGGEVGACSDLFDEKAVTSYEVQIDPFEWAAIHDEFVNWAARKAAGLDIKPYHAMTLHVGSEAVPAWIRLKGNSSWFSAVAANPNVKKQFVIAFDQGTDTKARFHGVQKVELDMPSLDRSFLHDRLAQSFLRDIGLPGLCANSAKLIINGEYYGLYANLEVTNHDFLKRVFPGPGEADGDLWKKRSDLQTNNEDPNRDNSRQRALWSSGTDINELATLMDMEASLRTWAAEALLPQPDGYWGGNSNFYVYDHPTRGFIFLTDDLDATFEFMPADMHPLYFWLNRVPPRYPGPQYVMVMNDAKWRGRFIEIIGQLIEGWDIGQLQQRVSTWAAQISDALANDPNRSGSFQDDQEQQGRLSDYVSARPAFVRSWLECVNGGGTDADGDGAAWCLDCDDTSPTTHPGAAEVCGDGVDQNCNGVADDGCG